MHLRDNRTAAFVRYSHATFRAVRERHSGEGRRRLLRILVPGSRTLCVLVLLTSWRASSAQAPDAAWRTIRTTHFSVHFTPSLEAVARRAAGEAERAWLRLSSQLTPPRGPIDIVVTDDQDISNGSATFFPTNRVVIYTRPPLDEPDLRFGDDWIQLVVTHELTHIFHLDRTGGWWRVAQVVFGRHPALFPNGRAPRWLSEGVAIAYESRMVGGGRLDGAELRSVLDNIAAHDASRLNPSRLSIATPYWPGGLMPYYGGARLVEQAERSGGDSAMRRFIDRAGSYPLPFAWDLAARSTFGVSFRSISATARAQAVPIAADTVAALTPPYWEVRAPRWIGDTIFFTGAIPRALTSVFAAYAGTVERRARRNGVSDFAAVRGTLVYSQLEFRGPYRVFSYLYEDDRRIAGSVHLADPDVRADGAIVATLSVDGLARIVRVDGRTGEQRPLTRADPNEQWSDARWSRRGDRIAAIRWTRGGLSALVVFDTSGAILGTYAETRAVQSHPSWDIDDRALVFTSDRSGRATAFRVMLTGSAEGVVQQIADGPRPIYYAEVSPDGREVAAFRMESDGYRLVRLRVPPLDDLQVRVPDNVWPPSRPDTSVTAAGATQRYAPWITLLPRYWAPTASSSARGATLAGAYTAGYDVVGRHSYALETAWDVRSGEMYAAGGWTYRGFGLPIIEVSASQGWTRFRVTDTLANELGELMRRNRVLALAATSMRPRVRSNVSLSVGTELEERRLRVYPADLFAGFDSLAPAPHRTYAAFVLSTGWSRVSRAPLALSSEDGVVASVTVRRRWRTDDPDNTVSHSILGAIRAYKSIPFPGHARHVLAVRASGGYAGPLTPTLFSAGGVSGTSVELFPGYRIGDGQRAFFVRGFAPGTLEGTRALGGGAEYRAPLPRIGRGIWPLPIFLQRASLSAFADAASAWCEPNERNVLCPRSGTRRETIASAGAEYALDATLDYDSPTRFRLGVALPLRGGSNISWYFSVGVPF